MRIILADDHALFKNSMKICLESQGVEVVAEASNGCEALRLVRECNPDVVLLDLNMPLKGGIEVAREIVSEGLKVNPAILTMYEDPLTILEAFQAGVRGYMLKTLSCTELVNALHQMAQGKLYLSSAITKTVVEAVLKNQPEKLETITGRERQVLQLVAEGNASKQIADILNLTVKTVESHRNRLMRKLEVRNVAGLVRYAIRERIIQA